jgi:serine/threonine-protein phosphatase PGAM5
LGERLLLLVRHAQYHSNADHESYGSLTLLGKRQAARTAKRLGDYSIHSVTSSTSPRALETTELFCSALGKPRFSRTPLLVEGIPWPFLGISPDQMSGMAEDRARMDEAFARYFRPSRQDRCELFVCHGNIIRYLLRRALDDDASRWSSLQILNCSLSIVCIRRDGARKLLAFNDAGHLPRKMQTYL